MKNRMMPSALASLALALSVLASAVIVYANNASEFTPPHLDHLAFYIMLALAAGAVAFAIAAVLGFRSRVATVLTTLSGLAFLANFIFASEVPPIDGAEHGYNPEFGRMAIELLLAIVVLAGLYVWAKAFPLAVAAGLVVIQSGAIAFAYSQLSSSQFSNPQFSKPQPANTALGKIAPLVGLSSELNVIHIMFDSLQADMFAEILEEQPDIRRELDGFVHYTDYAGYSNWTTLSLAAIQADKRFFDVHDGNSNAILTIAEWFRTDSIFSALSKQNMIVSAVQPGEAFCEKMAHTCVTLPRLSKEIGETPSARSTVRILGDLILLRTLPTALKPYVYNNGHLRLTSSGAEKPIERDITQSVKFARILAREMKVETATPVYRFFHFYPPHKPFILDDGCGAHPGLRDEGWASYKKQATCALKLFAGLVQAIKKAGVYDRTVIVLQADTGLGMLHSPETDPPIVSKVVPYSLARLVAYGRPTLAIKALGASGPLKSNATPASHFTTFELIADASEGRIQLSPAPEEGPREFVVSGIVRGTATRVAPYDLYQIRGPVADPSSWHALGTFSSPGVPFAAPKPDLRVVLQASPGENIAPGQTISLKAELSAPASDQEYLFQRRIGADDFVTIQPWSPANEVSWTVEDNKRTPCVAKLLVSARPIVRLPNDDKYATHEIDLPFAGCLN